MKLKETLIEVLVAITILWLIQLLAGTSQMLAFLLGCIFGLIMLSFIYLIITKVHSIILELFCYVLMVAGCHFCLPTIATTSCLVGIILGRLTLFIGQMLIATTELE